MANSKQRLQVNPILQDRIAAKENLQPAAAPVNVYFPPTLPQPVLDSVLDLAPLSQTLANIAVSHAQEQKQLEEQRLVGEAADPEKLRRFVDPGPDAQYWAQQLREGKIDPTESPYFYVVQKGVAGRRLAHLYQQKMLEFQDRLTTVNDGLNSEIQTPIGEAQMTFDQAHAEAMKFISESPAYSDPLVRGEFQAAIMDWGQSYQLRVDGLLREANKAFVEKGLTEEMVSLLQTRMEDGWQPGDAEALRAWDKSLRVTNPSVKDPRNIIVNAALAQASNLSRQRMNGEAYALLNRVAEIEIGGMTLGENPAFAGALDEALDHYERELDYEGESFVREDRRKEAEALVRGEDLWLPALNQAREANEDPLAAVSALFDQIRAGFPEYGEDIVEAATAAAHTAKRAQYSDPEATEALSQAYADGDVNRLALAYEVYGRGLLPEDRMRWRDIVLAERSRTTDLDRNQVWSSAREAIAREQRQAVTEKVDGLVQAQADQEISDLISTWEKGARGRVGNIATPEGAKEFSDWVERGSTEITQLIRKKGEEITLKKQALNAELIKAENTLGDIDAILDDENNLDYLTLDEQAAWREKANNSALEFETQFFNSPRTNELLRVLEAQVLEQNFDVEESLLTASRREVRFKEILEEELRPLLESTPKRYWETKALAPALATARERFLQELGVDVEGTKPRAGETLKQAEERVDKAKEGEANALSFYQAGEGGQVSPKNLPEWIPAELKAPVAYSLNARQSTPEAADRLLRTSVGEFIEKLNSNAELPPEARKKLLSTAIGLVGVSPQDVVDGQVRFREPIPFISFDRRFGGLGDPKLTVRRASFLPSDFGREGAAGYQRVQSDYMQNLQRAKDWVASQTAAGRTTGAVAEVQQQIDRAEQLMREQVYPLSALSLNPYLDIRFSSEEELQEWLKDPARWETLKAAAGVGTSDEEDERFSGFLWKRLDQ